MCVDCDAPLPVGMVGFYCADHGGTPPVPSALDPAVEETAHNIAKLPPKELAAYRAALADAPDDDPAIAHDRAALAVAVARGWVAP